MLGVQQIDRIVEVVEETLKGLLQLCSLESHCVYTCSLWPGLRSFIEENTVYP